MIKLFGIMAIDIEHLNQYLTPDEKNYLNTNLVSMEVLNSDLYSNVNGDNLEVLLNFLIKHAKDLEKIWEDSSKKEVLVKLYTSDTISGEYDCFRFDLSKFEQTFKSDGKQLTLYRIGRVNESKESLGNSWSKDFTGLKTYAQFVSKLENRPVFSIEVNESEVLCEGKAQESELILKKGFACNEIKLLSAENRLVIGV
ncbi:MAG: hypothetical protein ABJK37_09170 [Paraglaciecola sp.]|uniref:hypothetical protein n=1 Tax=Paraglaciecola sp. TaxID=1920173 RepID=UPI00329A4132